MNARSATENDILGDEASHRDFGRGDTEWGVVGWDGDKLHDDVASLGDGSDGPEGRTLVNVTLFKGRDLSKRPEKGKAQGRQIRAQIGGPLFAVPPLGTQVIVTFPGGDQETPGNGVITTWVQTSPTKQFKPSRAVLDFGPDFDFVQKARTIVLLDHTGDDDGQFSPWIGVGPIAGSPAGIYANDGHGAGFQAVGGVVGLMSTDAASPPKATGLLQLTATEVQLGLAGAGYLKIGAASCDAFHKVSCNLIAATVGLGTHPTLPPVTAALVPSTCVLISV